MSNILGVHYRDVFLGGIFIGVFIKGLSVMGVSVRDEIVWSHQLFLLAASVSSCFGSMPALTTIDFMYL